MDQAQFAIRPPLLTYNKDQQDELYARLLEVYQCTAMVPINEPDDVEMARDGTLVSSGYRMSYLALQQICRRLATGLWTFASDISGVSLRDDSVAAIHAPSLAISAINATCKLRFRAKYGLVGRHMIRNDADKIIDGVVGPGYRFLAHHQFLDIVRTLLDTTEHPAHFHSAQLIGRRLRMVFLLDDVFFRWNDYVFRGGYCFGNSEAGECSIYTAFTLQLEGTPHMCMAKPRTLHHQGKQFASKMRRLLTGTIFNKQEFDRIAENADATLGHRLDLMGEETINQARRKALGHTLVRAGMSQQSANTIVRDTIYRGAEGEAGAPRINAADIRARNGLDLYVAILRRAASLDIETREDLERIAYQFISGKVGVKLNHG